MYTWNFQYVSKARLAETLSQFMLGEQKGDVLVRIHTSIHLEEEAVDLARTIKELVPRAQIFGTSTSAVICKGRLTPNQCIISVTKMKNGSVRSVLQPTFDSDTGRPMSPDEVCMNVKSALINSDTKLLLAFVTTKYLNVCEFVDRCNTYFPGVPMTGGVAGVPEANRRKFIDSDFVFNEKGWSNKGIIAAAIGGKDVDCYCSYVSGVQSIGEDMEITRTFGNCIISVNGREAADEYIMWHGDEVKRRHELMSLLPFVYSDAEDIPVFVNVKDNVSIGEVFPEDSVINEELYEECPDIDRNEKHSMISVNHNVRAGRRLRRAFIYDRKIIADNRALFRRVENFEKAETVFVYSCITRSEIYSNCSKWELSAYENSNMCGCLTYGEIAWVNGRNVFANCTLIVTAIGEEKTVQQYNPYALQHTDSLAADNRELVKFLVDIERSLEETDDPAAAAKIKQFVKDCELKFLYSENDEIPNRAAMIMDISIRGYDRICMINVFDTASMKAVFPEQLVQLTYQSYISKCISWAKERHYTAYNLGGWNIAIGAPSYMYKLSHFAADMQALQKQLFYASSDHIAIVPIFCIIDGCTAENIDASYSAAQIEMMKRNIQFYVSDTRDGRLNSDNIRERSRMINVINYALAHDKVIPYYQGIHDNKTGTIHHYESLMRLEDENGKIYYPGSFLPAARSYSALYDGLSFAMISKVFDKFENIDDKSVSINLSVRDIASGKVFEYIYERLSTVRHPENFVFEILENEDIEDYDNIVMFVDQVHAFGAKISIDDFGSGYSNLQHIANIHCDYLKIDGSIVRNCCTDEQSANLTALIALWKKLSRDKFSVIAEFVENSDIQELLLKYGIDYSQGYLFSKPSPELMPEKPSEV